MAGGRIQPRLHALFQRHQQVVGGFQRLAVGGNDAAFKILASVIMNGHGHTTAMRRTVGRLNGIAVAETDASSTRICW